MIEKFFADIIGHTKIIESLMRAFFGNRMAHAYLFSGPAGIGKLKTAVAFARMLQCACEEGQDARCLVCKLPDQQAHPDIMTIVPQGATIKIEQIREIQKDIQLAPRTGKYKVFIIDGAERLTIQAANSLLKVLEDPPKYVVFILLTAQLHSLLPTIVSRCQQLAFSFIPEQDIAAWLIRQGFPEEKTITASVISGGVPGKAIMWAEAGQAMRDKAFWCLETLKQSSFGRMWDVVAELDQERDQVLSMFEIISIILRDTVVWQTTGKAELLLYIDCEQRIANLSERSRPDEILEVITEIEHLKRMLLGNANSRLLIEKFCLRLQDALAIQGGIC